MFINNKNNLKLILHLILPHKIILLKKIFVMIKLLK